MDGVEAETQAPAERGAEAGVIRFLSDPPKKSKCFVFFLSLVVSYAGSFDANVACSPAWKMPHCLILRCPKQFMHS